MLRSRPPSLASGLLLGFAALAYLAFLVALAVAIGFVLDWPPLPVGVDRGPLLPGAAAAAIDLGLLGAFAIQHSVMARPAFKRAWTRVIPAPAERSVFVLAASIILLLLCFAWRPIPTPIWMVASGAPAAILLGLSIAGFGFSIAATLMIDHLHLFGLRQAFDAATGRTPGEPIFVERAAYRFVRQPMMLGLLVAFWAAPKMTAGHLLFAVAASGFILVGTWFEERDLRHQLGATYDDYRARVSAFVPGLARFRRQATGAAGAAGLSGPSTRAVR